MLRAGLVVAPRFVCCSTPRMAKSSAMFSFSLGLLLLSGCARDAAPAADPSEESEFPQKEEILPPPATAPGAARTQLTEPECQAQSGEVVGDIGDGAIFQEAYLCPSGEAPLGNIVPSADAPIAIEGSVCCP